MFHVKHKQPADSFSYQLAVFTIISFLLKFVVRLVGSHWLADFCAITRKYETKADFYRQSLDIPAHLFAHLPQFPTKNPIPTPSLIMPFKMFKSLF